MSCPRPRELCSDYHCGGNHNGYCREEPKTEREQIINDLTVLKGLIEWDMPIDYQIIIDNAIELIRDTDKCVWKYVEDDELKFCEWRPHPKGFLKNPHTGRWFSNEDGMKLKYCCTCGKEIKIL